MGWIDRIIRCFAIVGLEKSGKVEGGSAIVLLKNANLSESEAMRR